MAAAETQKKVIVAEQLRSHHRLVVATKKWFEQDPGWPTSDETTPRGQTERGWTEVLDVDVTRSILGRALRLMDALIKAFEARGYVIRIQNTNHKRPTVKLELFVRKIERYETENNTRSGRPKNEDLVAGISDIRFPVLRSF